MEKKIIVMLVVVLCCSAPSFGLSFMGPPKAGLEQGQFGVGLNYTTGEMDLEFDLIGGFPTETEEVESDMLLVDLGYGINDQWEGFVRLGVAKFEMDGWDGGNEFAYGFGTRVTITEQDAITWGGLFQIVWFEGDDTILGADVDVDAYEIQIAIGPTYEAENVRIYGGPFLHLLDGDLDVEALGSADIEQESEIGLYVGGQFDLAENTAASVEVQFTADAWAIAGGVGYRF